MITRPTLLVDEAKARKNIRQMVEKCQQNGISFRPHFKTHQSETVGVWYREAGIQKITVSSVVMAEYFVNHGWEDVLIAFPYNPLEAASVASLAQKAKIGILVESVEALEHAKQYISTPINYHLAIDCGYHRTGISWLNVDMVQQLTNYETQHHFAGWVTHAGHTYSARGKDKVQETHREALDRLRQLKTHFSNAIHISYGDTPSASICEKWEGIDELRCGNIVYYDLTQTAIGSCDYTQIAVAVACPVVAKHPDRNELIIYGGGVHFSKDRMETSEGTLYGLGVRLTDVSWEILHQVRLVSLSQEHGKVSAPREFIEGCQIGDIIGFLPVHSCMTADLLVLQQTLTGQLIKKILIK